MELETLCRQTIQELERAGHVVAQYGAALIAEGATVLTHSYSQTVEASLLAAHARGLRFRIVVTESYPLGEGVRLAAALEKAGLRVSLVRDDAVSANMPVTSLVLVGADAVSPAGVVNKVGTSEISRLAREYRVPLYVVCTSDKLVTAHELDDPERLYDVTPLNHVTAIVTEDGLIAPERLR
jgi:translation initiation factor 2B subunit (eIF-2B alpha/beta/delta family)